MNMMRLMVIILGLFLLCCFDAALAQSPGDWPMFGQNTENTASNAWRTASQPRTSIN
jgi:hypothetical protein